MEINSTSGLLNDIDSLNKELKEEDDKRKLSNQKEETSDMKSKVEEQITQSTNTTLADVPISIQQVD